MSMRAGRKTERHGMDWLIAGVLLILIVAMLVRLKKSESRRP
jgi:hypothetical protein